MAKDKSIFKSFKKFSIDGNSYTFDDKAFDTKVKEYKKSSNKTFTFIEQELADLCFITPDSIRNYRRGNNGPGDIETIKKLSDYLHLEDYKTLLRKTEGDNMALKLTDSQLQSLKRVYDEIIEFLTDFYYSDGFIWLKGSYHDKYDQIEVKLRRIEVQLQKEYFYLGKTILFEELEEYYETDLYNLFEEKLDPSYRIGSTRIELYESEGIDTSVWHDYNVALDRINEITNKYIG